MSEAQNLNPFKNFKADIPASIVVFLVAMPLCLGIAMASGAPLFSGLISGIIGGIIVGALSGSSLGVSGPAAGLAVIVLNAITDLGGFENFLVAVVLAGVLQLIMGYAKAGIIGYYFPSSVIHGMLSGIGILIFLKQIPHAFGYDKDPEGDFRFIQPDNQNTFSELINMLDYVTLSPVIVTVGSLGILLLWETKLFKGFSFTKIIPGPLVAVAFGIIFHKFVETTTYDIINEHTVFIPVASSFDQFLGNFTLPNWSVITDYNIWVTAAIIAVVASLETLLSVEATDKLDPLKRVSPTNKELKAQGIGNILSGLIGGLPVTQVIVRSSANIQSGARTRMSAIIHGFLILISIILIPEILNLIPKATLAAILFVVGYKLAKPSLFKKVYNQGLEQFIPFVCTIIFLIFSDLLTGITAGLIISIIVILINNFRVPYVIRHEELGKGAKMKITLSENLSFMNKASLLETLKDIPDNSIVELDGTQNHFMHYDALEIIENFLISAETRNIKVTLIDVFETSHKVPEYVTIETKN